MERKNAWKKYTDEKPARGGRKNAKAAKPSLAQLEEVCAGYIDYLSTCKTERLAVEFAIKKASKAGYKPLADAVAKGRKLKAGAKLWADIGGKSVVLVQLGKRPMEEGLNILGAHIDSPRLDIKQNPLYETSDMTLLDTHYYGGIKTYQWVTMPLALYGVVVKKSGEVVKVAIGDDPADPVFCVTDLLPHLGAEQMKKPGSKLIEGESLDLLFGSKPLVVAEADVERIKKKKNQSYADELKVMSAKDGVKANVLSILLEEYGIEEEDFLSAELEVVPAGRARELGIDRAMILGYGQDDSACAYPSLMAQLAVEAPERTSVCILVDKEEIGSVGATGMTSLFFENTIAEIMELAGEGGQLALRRCLANSNMLSSDVSAGFDPAYALVFEEKNAAFCGRGLVFNKYVGSGGKSGSNDANAEYMAFLRRVMDEAGVAFQTAEIGRVNAGGGGTIAYILAKYGMNVIDSGVPVLSMHSPWEVTSKVDIYEAYLGYQAFLRA